MRRFRFILLIFVSLLSLAVLGGGLAARKRGETKQGLSAKESAFLSTPAPASQINHSVISSISPGKNTASGSSSPTVSEAIPDRAILNEAAADENTSPRGTAFVEAISASAEKTTPALGMEFAGCHPGWITSQAMPSNLAEQKQSSEEIPAKQQAKSVKQANSLKTAKNAKQTASTKQNKMASTKKTAGASTTEKNTPLKSPARVKRNHRYRFASGIIHAQEEDVSTGYVELGTVYWGGDIPLTASRRGAAQPKNSVVLSASEHSSSLVAEFDRALQIEGGNDFQNLGQAYADWINARQDGLDLESDRSITLSLQNALSRNQIVAHDIRKNDAERRIHAISGYKSRAQGLSEKILQSALDLMSDQLNNWGDWMKSVSRNLAGKEGLSQEIQAKIGETKRTR